MAIIQNTARELGLALPLSAQVAEMMNALIAHGGGELDHSALVNIYEELAQTRITNPQ
jgi:2-hydroxy-3-oxopropionate reductase